MKKKKYLMRIFMHLHAPLKERIQMVKDLRRSLDDKLAEGETMKKQSQNWEKPQILFRNMKISE